MSRRFAKLAARQAIAATAWMLVPALVLAGIPRWECLCNPAEMRCHATLSRRAHAAPNAESASAHSCCQREQPEHGPANSASGVCHCGATAASFVLTGSPPRISAPAQALVAVVSDALAGEPERCSVASGERCAEPPPDDLLVTLRRLQI